MTNPGSFSPRQPPPQHRCLKLLQSDFVAMETNPHLLELEYSGFVRRADDADPAYLFRHILSQESAYQSLLGKKRREIHRLVAQAYEQFYPDRLDEDAAILTQHYAEAGDDAKALEYGTRAGDWSLRAYANVEALAHYTRALQVRKKIGGSSEEWIGLYSKRGRTLEVSGQFDLALANYEEMDRVARERGDRSMELASLVARATIRSSTTAVHDPAQAQTLAQKALALARDIGDQTTQAKILWNLSLFYSLAGNAEESVEYGEQSVAIAREYGLREQLAYSLNDISFGYFGIGQVEKARLVLEEANRLWRELGIQNMLGDNVGRSAMIALFSGDFEHAIQLGKEDYRISQAIGNVWGLAESRWNEVMVLTEYGEWDQAIRIAEEVFTLSEQAGHVGARVRVYILLAWIYDLLGDSQHAIQVGRQAIEKAADLFPAWEPWASASLGLIYQHYGDTTQADALVKEAYSHVAKSDFITFPFVVIGDGEVEFEKKDYAAALERADQAIAFFGKSGTRMYLGDAYHLRGQVLLAQGKVEEARDALLQGRAVAESMRSRRALLPILITLAEIQTLLGEHTGAKDLRRQAREIVEYLAAHAPLELRPSFLNLPHVRAALE